MNNLERKKQKRPFWKLKRVKWGIPLLLVIVIGVIGYQVAMKYASEKMVKQISTQIPKNEISSLLKDPSIQKMIEDEVGAEKQKEILQNFSVDVATATGTPAAQNPNATKKSVQAIPAKRQETATGHNASSKSQPVVKPEPSQSGTGTATEKDNSNSAPVHREESPTLQFKTQQDVQNFLLTKFTLGELVQFASQAQGGLTEEEKVQIKAKVLSRLTDREYQALKVFAILQLSK